MVSSRFFAHLCDGDLGGREWRRVDGLGRGRMRGELILVWIACVELECCATVEEMQEVVFGTVWVGGKCIDVSVT